MSVAPRPDESTMSVATAQPEDWSWDGDGSGDPEHVTAGPAVRTDLLYRCAEDTDTNANQESSSTNSSIPEAAGMMAAMGDGGEANAVPIVVGPGTSTPPPAATRYVDAGKGVGTWMVALILVASTSLAGLIDMSLNRQITWITGVTFVAACIVSALIVRRRDLWTAVITPPLAFLASLIIAGQPSALSGTGDLVLKEVSLVATGLAFNAPFVFGGTLAALLIVLVRRSRFRRKDR